MYETDGDDGHTHTFTLSEARSLLPLLRSLLRDMAREWNALAGLQREVGHARSKAAYNGGTRIGPLYLKHLMAFGETLEKIQGIGVLVKDLRTGLIDFPYEHDGRVVYLCWHPDEEEIGWWHEVDSGFSGRQPLTDNFD